MFNKGDKCVHYTKYGSINIIEIGEINHNLGIDTTNNLIYRNYYIVTTNGVRLELDGSDGKIFHLHRTITEEESKKFTEGFARMGKEKVQMQEKIKNLKLPGK